MFFISCLFFHHTLTAHTDLYMFPGLVSFVCFCFCLVFIFSHYIIFSYYTLEAHLFSNERQKRSGSRRCRGTGGADRGGEMLIRVYYVRKIYFQYRGKKCEKKRKILAALSPWPRHNKDRTCMYFVSLKALVCTLVCMHMHLMCKCSSKLIF